MLIGKTVCRKGDGYWNSLYYLLNFSVKLKLFQKIKSINRKKETSKEEGGEGEESLKF